MEIILNGERIPAQVCEQETERVQREHPDWDSRRAEGQARESLVARGLLRQNAFNSGIGVSSEEVDEEIRRIAAGYGGEAQFYQALGLSKKQHERRVRRDIQERIRIDKFVASLAGDAAAPTEERVEDYCREHASDMVRPPMVRASHIVKRPEPGTSAALYKAMLAVREKLLAGAEFAQVAKEHSASDDGGGDLGTFPPGRMVDEFDAPVFSMKAGEVSPVFLTPFGYHVVKVWETEAERPMTHEEALAAARALLTVRTREEHLAAWITAKREVAVIDVRP
jgi:parvulin-like peptidyl-prolyl isomerase